MHFFLPFAKQSMPVIYESTEDRVERRYRELYRCIEQLFVEHSKRKAERTQAIFFGWNQACLSDLQRVESSNRFLLEDDYLEFFRRHDGALRLIRQREGEKKLKYERLISRCDDKHGSNLRRDMTLEKQIEHADLEEGRRALKDERRRAAEEQKEREKTIEKRRAERESLGKALAFISGEETRGRYALNQEQVGAWRDFLQAERHGLENLDSEIAARWLATDEGRAQRAAEEAKAEEQRKAALKKEQDFKKEQHRLKNKCTHSRNGTSVFVGAFPKKMCLICKVKYDATTGLYHAM